MTAETVAKEWVKLPNIISSLVLAGVIFIISQTVDGRTNQQLSEKDISQIKDRIEEIQTDVELIKATRYTSADAKGIVSDIEHLKDDVKLIKSIVIKPK